MKEKMTKEDIEDYEAAIKEHKEGKSILLDEV
jgi:hypothetical protein